MLHNKLALMGNARQPSRTAKLATFWITTVLLLFILGTSRQAATTDETETPAAQLNWTSIGPRNAGGWGGKVNAFAYVESNPSVMYIGAGWGNTPRESPSQMGIYRTTDGGAHWTEANQGLTNADGTISSVVNSLWLDQKNPSVVLASTEFGGTFKSSDGGTTWNSVDRFASTRFSQAGAVLYVASRKGVLQSTDDGSTWTVSLSLPQSATTVATAAGVTFAGSGSGDVYQLSGDTWTKLGHPGTGPIHDLAVDPFDTTIVYANVDDKTAWNQNLYGSVDGGNTWTSIQCNCSIGPQAIAFSNVTPHRLYLGDDGSGAILYFKADGNPQPQISRGASGTVDVRYIVPAAGQKADDACYVLQDQGLWFTPTCSSGRISGLSLQVNNTLVYDVAVSPDGMKVEAPLQDNSSTSSQNGGKSWPVSGPAAEGGEARYHPDNSGYCYIAHPDEALFISKDGCATFPQVINILPESLTFDPSNANTLYAVTGEDNGAAQISKSVDKGATWKATGWNFTNPYQVAVAPSDAKSIVVATGTATSPPKLFYSHDGGVTWKQSGAALETQQVSPDQIWFPTHRLYAAFDPKDAQTVLLADHDPKTDNVRIYRSSDGAQTFTLAHTFVQPKPQRPWPVIRRSKEEMRPRRDSFYYATRFYGNRVVFNPAAQSGDPAMVVTTRFGAFLSMDLGTTWKRIDTTAVPHHFIGAAWAQGYVFLASFGEGIIRSNKAIQP
ncbi:MAG: hypothetical protein LAO09_22495 [Acidobacteriia bacterium]|nr:hypothetical protein [Terriglobia bacterium]